jgi:hypothetical protein
MKEPTEFGNENSVVELVTKAEYDIQIATAKKYPRSVRQFIQNATELVTLNEATSEDCIYALPRAGKTIEGPSARFAEIILHAWGHTRAGARIVNEDGRFITAQGVCHDLQSNTLITYEIRRRITNKSGKRFDDDMIGVTGNAAASIALRNAITKVIPKALWEPVYQEARKVVMGDSKTLANRRASALVHLQKFGVTEEMVLKKLEIKGIEDITLDHLVTLRGIATALKEGEHTMEKIFLDEASSSPSKKPNDINDILNKSSQESFDPQTGEIISPAPAKHNDPLNASIDAAMAEQQNTSNNSDNTHIETVDDSEQAEEIFPLDLIPALVSRTGAELKRDASNMIKHLEKTQQEQRKELLERHDPGLLNSLSNKGMGQIKSKITKLLQE